MTEKTKKKKESQPFSFLHLTDCVFLFPVAAVRLGAGKRRRKRKKRNGKTDFIIIITSELKEKEQNGKKR